MTHQEVLRQKRRDFSFGSVVTNCVSHMAMPLTGRPEGCRLCRADVKNQLHRAIKVNAFLNDLVDDWEKLPEPGPPR